MCTTGKREIPGCSIAAGGGEGGGSFFTLVWVLCARSALPHNKFVFQRVDDVVLTAEDLLMLNMCGWEIG